jgi:hypothetical protein
MYDEIRKTIRSVITEFEIVEYLNKANDLCKYCLIDRERYNWEYSTKSLNDYIKQ